MSQPMTCAISVACLVRRGTDIEFVGEEGDPRREAVARLVIDPLCAADLAMIEDLPIIDETEALNPIIFVL